MNNNSGDGQGGNTIGGFAVVTRKTEDSGGPEVIMVEAGRE